MILMGSGELLKPEDTKFGFAALTHLNNINSADVLIRIQDGGMYPTHRAYLQRLPSFQAHCNFKDESVQIIKLFLPAPHQFRPLLEFIYRGDDIIDPILLAPEWFLDTLRNSAFLNIETIVEACIFQFPLVFSEMLLKEDFHHTRIPLETLSRLLQGPTKSTTNVLHLTSTSSWTSVNTTRKNPSSSWNDEDSKRSSAFRTTAFPIAEPSGSTSRTLTAVQMLDAILTWARQKDSKSEPAPSEDVSSCFETLAAARNLVIKVVTPRLQDGSLNLTTWADLVGRHGFEDETITTMRSVAIASSAALDKGKKVVPTDTSLRLKRQFDTNDSPDMDLGVRASEKEERERVRDQGDVVMRDGSDLKELCNLFTASNPFSFIVPQSLMIYASSILCVRSKKEGEQKAAQELARLKTRKQCRRCGELVTIAELEVGSMTCLQIEPIQPSSTPSATFPTPAPSSTPEPANRHQNLSSSIGIRPYLSPHWPEETPQSSTQAAGQSSGPFINLFRNQTEGVLPSRREQRSLAAVEIAESIRPQSPELSNVLSHPKALEWMRAPSSDGFKRQAANGPRTPETLTTMPFPHPPLSQTPAEGPEKPPAFPVSGASSSHCTRNASLRHPASLPTPNSPSRGSIRDPARNVGSAMAIDTSFNTGGLMSMQLLSFGYRIKKSKHVFSELQ